MTAAEPPDPDGGDLRDSDDGDLSACAEDDAQSCLANVLCWALETCLAKT